MSKKLDRFPGARSYRDRHGKVRWRFREKGFTAELGTEWGSEDFRRRYAEAVNRRKPGAGHLRTIPGSLGDLVARWYAVHFPTIDASTRKAYRSVIEPQRVKHGHKRVSHMRRRHVEEIKAELAGTPGAANNTLKRLSQLMDYAMVLEWRTDNPVKGVKHFPMEGGGFHSWDEGEIARFLEVHPLGTAAHLAMTLMLYTGAARVDAVKLGRGNVKDGRLDYRRQKTRKNPKGILVNIPVHPALAEVLELVPAHAFTFLQTAHGKARTASGLGTRMREWCDAAGLPLCSSHGLRKAICRRLAEAGATAPEIMSVSGHTTLAEVQRYIDAFGRQNAADVAFSKLSGGPKPEQSVTNHPARFVKPDAKPLKAREK
jgi:integrase